MRDCHSERFPCHPERSEGSMNLLLILRPYGAQNDREDAQMTEGIHGL